MRNRRALAAVVAAAAIVVGASTVGRADTFNLRLGSGHPPGQHYVDLFRSYLTPELKKRVAEKTKHKVNVLEAYSASIVKVTETLRGVERGLIDMGGFCFCFEPSNLPLHSFPVWLPFFPEDPHVSQRVTREVYDAFPELNGAFEAKYNQKLLAIWPIDPYGIIAKIPINKASDISGQRLGAAGPNAPWIDRVGAVPVQTSAGEIYNSIQTGVMQGAVIYITAVNGLRLGEVAKYWNRTGHGTIVWQGLTINMNTWKKLPKDVQDILVELGKDFEKHVTEYTVKQAEDGIAKAKSMGVQIVDLPAPERQVWAEALKAWPAEKAKEMEERGLPGRKVLNMTLDVAEKHGYKWPVRYKID